VPALPALPARQAAREGHCTGEAGFLFSLLLKKCRHFQLNLDKPKPVIRYFKLTPFLVLACPSWGICNFSNFT
jgi:hypothetical protein